MEKYVLSVERFATRRLCTSQVRDSETTTTSRIGPYPRHGEKAFELKDQILFFNPFDDGTIDSHESRGMLAH